MSGVWSQTTARKVYWKDEKVSLGFVDHEKKL